jgi:HlyD family secretion protein
VKKALVLLAVLAVALAVGLSVRLHQLHSANRGPPGGTGVVEGLDVSVISRLATRITSVEVREGDMVKRGQVVVKLDCTDQDAALAQAKAELDAMIASASATDAGAESAGHNASAARANAAAARAQIEALQAQERLAKLDLDRTRSLVESGAVPRANLDNAIARHDALHAQIAAQKATKRASQAQAGAAGSTRTGTKAQAEAAKRRIDAARQGVARAEEAVRECTLVAPRAGLVATRSREPGEAVLPGSVILTITDISDARTRFYLPNDDLAAAKPGGKVRVVADAYPDVVFEGTIASVSPRAEFTPRNVQTREDRERLVYAVELRIPNPDMKLRAGMPVEVTIEEPAAAAVGLR